MAWLIGIDYGYLLQSGQLLGTRTVLNEFVSVAVRKLRLPWPEIREGLADLFAARQRDQ